MRGRVHFNPRTHMGCDHDPVKVIKEDKNFNPRTHMGCDAQLFRYFLPCVDFNPRTHMGCDMFMDGLKEALSGISIHAPTWGATLYA